MSQNIDSEIRLYVSEQRREIEQYFKKEHEEKIAAALKQEWRVIVVTVGVVGLLATLGIIGGLQALLSSNAKKLMDDAGLSAVTAEAERYRLQAATSATGADADAKKIAENLKDVLALGAVPKGTIVAWTGDAQLVPTGWAVCDGINGTPNLLGKFLRGAKDASEVGGVGGQEVHTHDFKAAVPTVDRNLSDKDHGDTPWRDDKPAPYRGDVSGKTSEESSLPPFYNVVYIVKL